MKDWKIAPQITVLDKESKVPLYKQLYYILKSQIVDEVIKDGEEFYSENDLMKLFDVSRITVRSTLQMLESDGYLKKSQGNASIVVNQNQFMWNLYEITGDLMKFDDLKTELKSISLVKPSDKVLDNLMLPYDTKTVFRIERIRNVKGYKMARSISYLPSSLPIDLNNVGFEKDNSITKLLRNLGENPTYCEETIEAVNADDKTCKLLDLPSNSAVFYRNRVTFNDKDIPLEYVESYYNSKYTKYFVKNKLL
ncbi:GntR family transcriptional regulator [Enterococcus hulanensis]|uniref:GntR family transcriptional regulator n=1 Tax=Enterococcus hulanensis TaxID=2559929 RepID=UPI001A904F00|nr:GntR family transcriptional regulator [Enterococcus hulanensis]MBO0455835.1 GntR family transcriptional regulator [Enterococcus hulanensis]